MKARYLVEVHDTRHSTAITGDGGNHIAFTQHRPEYQGRYMAELTRAQWDELRRVKWSTPVIDGGFLIPDVDFVADDGTVFQDAEACMEHESLIKSAKAACGIFAGWMSIPLDRRSLLEESFVRVLDSVGVKNSKELLDELTRDQFPTSQVGETVTASGFEPDITGSTPVPAAITGDVQPPTLESRLLTAVAGGKVHINKLVESLQVERDDIKAAVAASEFLTMDRACVTLKSITL